MSEQIEIGDLVEVAPQRGKPYQMCVSSIKEAEEVKLRVYAPNYMRNGPIVRTYGGYCPCCGSDLEENTTRARFNLIEKAENE